MRVGGSPDARPVLPTGGIWSGFFLNDTVNEKELEMLSEYKWIVLQNLNDGLGLIWLALLVGTTVSGIDLFMTIVRNDEALPCHGQRKRWFRSLLGILLLSGTLLVALPDKEQIALLRGEPVGNPSEPKSFVEKKVIIMPVE
jgi:hypothetical protein